MSATAIMDTTVAIKNRIEAAAAEKVYIGPPVRADMGSLNISLFLFLAEPNTALRNAPRHQVPSNPGAAGEELAPRRLIPLDLHYLLSAFRTAGGGPQADPSELHRLGKLIQALESDPVLTGVQDDGEPIRLTLESASVDELNRIWSVFPDENFQTSLAYLASPVWITGLPLIPGPSVTVQRHRFGAVATTEAEHAS